MTLMWVTKHTRAGKAGKVIFCPGCGSSKRVYHFRWWAIVCQVCEESVLKQEWRVEVLKT